MLTLYCPGRGPLHRMPTGPKTLLLLAAVLAVSLLPSTWWAAVTAAVMCTLAYLIAGVGTRGLWLPQLGRNVVALRWVVVVTLTGQLLFLGVEPAVANTARVTAAVVLAGLLVLTTPVTALLDALEHGLSPLARLRLDPQRAALVLTVTLSTFPVLACLAHDVREAQRARGGRASLRFFAVPYLVLALKHADQLGDALTARGVR